MLDGKLFDVIATLADALRKKTEKPFGGMQVSCLSFPVKIMVSLTVLAGHNGRFLPIAPSHEGRDGTNFHFWE